MHIHSNSCQQNTFYVKIDRTLKLLLFTIQCKRDIKYCLFQILRTEPSSPNIYLRAGKYSKLRGTYSPY